MGRGLNDDDLVHMPTKQNCSSQHGGYITMDHLKELIMNRARINQANSQPNQDSLLNTQTNLTDTHIEMDVTAK